MSRLTKTITNNCLNELKPLLQVHIKQIFNTFNIVADDANFQAVLDAQFEASKEEFTKFVKTVAKQGAANLGNVVAKQQRKKNIIAGAPKAAVSGFFHFVSQKRSEVTSLQPNEPKLKQPEVMKRLGAMWQALGEAGQAQYNQIAEQDKARYVQEKAVFDYQQSQVQQAQQVQVQA